MDVFYIINPCPDINNDSREEESSLRAITDAASGAESLDKSVVLHSGASVAGVLAQIAQARAEYPNHLRLHHLTPRLHPHLRSVISITFGLFKT